MEVGNNSYEFLSSQSEETLLQYLYSTYSIISGLLILWMPKSL